MSACALEETAVDHQPVMLSEVLEALAPRQDRRYLDGTLGAGGHAAALLRTAGPGAELVGLDRDPLALELAARTLEDVPGRVRLIQGRFEEEIPRLTREGRRFAGILLDLGVSSMQLDGPDRGFSFRQDGPLDMRMDTRGSRTAADLLREETEERISWILFHWGEERFARRIARRIVAARQVEPLTSTLELARLVESAIPRRAWPKRLHPATRTFQAIRIAVNGELEGLGGALESAFEALEPQGRLVVLTFHSLEDRIAKHTFRSLCLRCICPPEIPVCRCAGEPRARKIGPQPLRPTPEEVEANYRSRSAKMRSVEKLDRSRAVEKLEGR